VARRSTPRRSRSRKRRTVTDARPGQETTVASAGATSATTVDAPRTERTSRQRPPATSRSRNVPSSAGLGERPRAPWHPLPLSELLILVGMIGAIVGATQEAIAPLVAGLAAVAVGTVDFTVREHLSGYRSHATLLASLPTALLHGLLAIALLAAGAPSPSWIVAPLAVDVPVFLFLFRALRARFSDARRRRVLAG
jgi:hypothetical protein